MYTIWDFYIKGHLISVETKEIKWNRNKEKKELYIYKKILKLEIPKEIENEKEQILKDLKEAFGEAFGDPFYALNYNKDKNNNNNKFFETCIAYLEYNGELI
ncbi:MAG: hypothetical protein LBG67_01285 [Campylobacteraceae bacterium]|jgi:predicted outer membrane protein|nr:hypothetical protein [Campylobacteraceae bacterium]